MLRAALDALKETDRQLALPTINPEWQSRLIRDRVAIEEIIRRDGERLLQVVTSESAAGVTDFSTQ